MSTVHRCAMAVQIARLIVAIHAVPVPSGIGPLSVDNFEKLCLGHFRDDDADDADEEGNMTDHTVHYGSTPQKLPEFIQMLIMNIHASALRRSPDDTYIPKLCVDLERASRPLLCGVQLTNRNVLFHRDFAARNILVTYPADRGSYFSRLLTLSDCGMVLLAISPV